jgi:hypothetical protein
MEKENKLAEAKAIISISSKAIIASIRVKPHSPILPEESILA